MQSPSLTEEIRKGWRENEARKAGCIAGAAARSSLQKDTTVPPYLQAVAANAAGMAATVATRNALMNAEAFMCQHQPPCPHEGSASKTPAQSKANRSKSKLQSQSHSQSQSQSQSQSASKRAKASPPPIDLTGDDLDIDSVWASDDRVISGAFLGALPKVDRHDLENLTPRSRVAACLREVTTCEIVESLLVSFFIYRALERIC